MQDDTNVAHVVRQGFGDLLIDKIEEIRLLIDQGHFDAQEGQDAGVFCADDTSPDHNEAAGQLDESAQPVRIDNHAILERNGGRTSRYRSCSNDNVISGDRSGLVRRAYRQGMFVGKRGLTFDHLYPVSFELRDNDTDFILDYPCALA